MWKIKWCSFSTFPKWNVILCLYDTSNPVVLNLIFCLRPLCSLNKLSITETDKTHKTPSWNATRLPRLHLLSFMQLFLVNQPQNVHQPSMQCVRVKMQFSTLYLAPRYIPMCGGYSALIISWAHHPRSGMPKLGAVEMLLFISRQWAVNQDWRQAGKDQIYISSLRKLAPV